jgi:iron complex transport system substrate-binding protein
MALAALMAAPALSAAGSGAQSGQPSQNLASPVFASQKLASQILVAQNLVALEREGYPVAFQNGHRVVTVHQRPEKVVVFGLGPAELLIELGLAELVVGRSSLDDRFEPLPRYAEALASIPEWKPGSMEAKEAADGGPDFAYGRLDPQAPEMELGFLTVYTSLAGNKSEYYKEVEDLAAIFRVEDRAGAFLAAQEERLAGLSRKVSAREPVRVMVVKELNDDRLVTVGGPDFANDILKLGGALNIFADLGRSPEATREEAAKRHPGFIVVVNDGNGSTAETLSRLRSDPVLSTLEAVTADRVMTIDETWLSPGPRLAEAAELLAKELHPAVME